MRASLAPSLAIAATLSTAIALAACGGSTSQDAPAPADSTPAPVADSGGGPVVDSAAPPDTAPPPPRDSAPVDTGPEVDRGAPSDVYPAFKGALPQLMNNGGYVMTAPTVVTITWPGDKNADRFEAFGDTIGATDYWKAITSEYGIAPAVSGAANHVRITDPAPTTWTTADVEAYVAAQVGDLAKSKWPAPKDDSIYVLYLSPSTQLDYNGAPACDSIGGYHSSTDTAVGEVSFAVIPYCRGFSGDYFESMTAAASHELGEAATDPQPRVRPGYVGFDGQHLSWELFQILLTENGDSCTFYDDSFFNSSEPTFAYKVQRQWSNKAAAGTHNPCVPNDGTPYVTAVPLALDTVTIDMSSYGGPTRQRTKGYAIGVGETRLIQFGLVSDAPTGDWGVDVLEGPVPGYGGGGDTGHLDLSFVGPSKGRNGEKITVAVKVLSLGKTKGELMSLVSTDASGRTRYAPVLIGSL